MQQKDIRRLIDSVTDARDRLMIRIIYETGCTVTELVNIKVSDILGHAIRIEERFSQISGKLSRDIADYVLGNRLGKESFLIKTRQNFSMSEKRVSQIIEEYGHKILNARIRPHDLRNLHIVHAYTNGVFIESISKQLGLTAFRVFQIINTKKVTRHNYTEFLGRI